MIQQRLQNKLRIKFEDDDLSNIGQNSILGIVMTQLSQSDSETRKIDSIELVFPQTTQVWRENHGGPRAEILPEYVVPSILSDVLYLVAHQYEVTISMPEKDPS